MRTGLIPKICLIFLLILSMQGNPNVFSSLRSLAPQAAFYESWSSPKQISLNGSYPKIAIDLVGKAHIVWRQNANLYYSNNLGDKWSIPINLSNTDNPNATVNNYHLAFDKTGLLHIVWDYYSEIEGESSYILYKEMNPNLGWSGVTETIAQGYRLSGPTLAVDMVSGIHVAYIEGWNTSGADVYYLHRSPGGSWDLKERITQDVDRNWNYFPSIIVDSTLKPHVAWWGNPFQKYSSQIGRGNWSMVETVGSLDKQIQNNPNLIIDAEDTIYSLGHNIYDGAYICNKPKEDNWACELITGSPDTLGVTLNQPSLVINKQNELLAVWKGASLAIRSTSGSWHSSKVVPDGIGMDDPTIAIDFAGNLHITYSFQGSIFYIRSSLNVPLFYQGSPSTPRAILDNLPQKLYPYWESSAYGDPIDNPVGDTIDTIGRWGCNLASNAMVINYYAQKLNLDFSTDPDILNAYLRDKHGYNSNSGVRYKPQPTNKYSEPSGSIEDYARENGIPLILSPIRGSFELFQSKVDNSLNLGNPVMLQVQYPTGSNCKVPPCTHWFVATGKTINNNQSTYLINDPIWGRIPLNSRYGTPTAAVFYNLIACFPSFPTCHIPTSLQITAYSPVHLLVTDPEGRKQGYDPRTNTNWDEIPDAAYVIDAISDPNGDSLPETKTIYISSPSVGYYSIAVNGYDSGSYKVEINKILPSGEVIQEIYTGVAQPSSLRMINTAYFTSSVYLPVITRFP